MSEFLAQPAYSLNARAVNERFANDPDGYAKMAEYGLVATNNLGMRMRMFEDGPDCAPSKSIYDTFVPPRARDLLDMARALEPELWQKTLEVHDARNELLGEYIKAIQAHGVQDPRVTPLKEKCYEIERQDAEFKTQMFAVLDPHMTTDEAIDLCV